MYNIINISKSGISANQEKINIISNNMVNVGTTGYKKLEVNFQDLVRETLNRDSYPNNNPNSTVGTGVRTTNEMRNFTQGILKDTKIMSNLAIDGEGFFRVITPENTYAYTRNGEFNMDSNGKLVDDNGNILDIQFYNNNNYSNLKITQDNIEVNKQGEVSVDGNKIGKINLYKSEGDNDFLAKGDSLFVAKNGANITIENTSNIMQGYVEMSNVDMAQEVSDLISVQRAFQLNTKGITVADDMWSMINNLQSR